MNQNKSILVRGFGALASLFLLAQAAQSATYYISPSGSDSNNGLSQAAPLKSFSKAFSTISGGDELVLLDGAYSNSAGTGFINYDDGSCSSCAEPPSGTSLSAMTYVHAQNEGSVTVDGGSRPGLFLGRSPANGGKTSYVKVQGIRFEGGGTLYNTSYCTIKDCGFHDTSQGGGSVFTVGTIDHNDGNTYNLIEDVWVWGQDRVIAINYRANYNVWRRVVVRGDGCGSSACSGSGNPNVGFSVYDSQHNSIQNMVVIDRTLGGGSPYADFATAQHDPGTGLGSAEYLGPNEWLGCISLKSPDSGFQFEADNANDNTHTLRNIVAWNSASENVNIAGQASNIILQNVTAGVSASGSNVRVAPAVVGGTVRDIVAYNAGLWGINSVITPSNVDVYGAAGGSYNQTACSVGCKSTNPLSDGTPTSLEYIARVESGSALSGTDSGTDIGANIVKRYGTDGTRYGDPGYDALSSTDLWPWPNQGAIQTQFASVTGGARGFAASGTDLTKYVWEQLGNTSPYGGSGDTTPPTVSITAPANGATVSGTTSVTASASDNVGVSKVEFYVDGALKATAASSPYSYSWDTTGAANGSHTVTAKAYDAAGNNASASATVTVSNADTTPPTVSVSTPANGSTVSGTVSVQATASDNVGVSTVEFLVDGALRSSDASSPYSYSWDTTGASNGSHTVAARARDAAGNTATSSVTVTVSNSVPDTTPPSVSITSPVDGSTVSATVSVAASASDNVGVSKVEFYVDGALKGTDTTSPYGYSWDTTAAGNGSHTLTAKAYDAAGNTASASATVTVSNADTTPPTVSLTNPANGATVAGTVSVAASASDNVGVAKVEFYVDGALKGTDTTSPYGYSWDTTGSSNGSHTVLAKAYDAAGNTTSASATVTVSNADTTPPTVSVTSPADGSTVSGSVTVSAMASDNVGVSRVEFYVDGTLKGTASSSPYAYVWDTTAGADGTHTVLAKAYDAAGNSASSSVNVTVSNSPDSSPPAVAITYPANGATVSRTVSVTADASDNVGVTKVEFLVDGALRATDTSAPYGFSWDTHADGKGQHTLSAKAYDAAGNTATASITVTVVYGRVRGVLSSYDPLSGTEGAYVYPNPVVSPSEPVIRTTLPEDIDRVDINIFDLSGQLVHSGAITSGPSGAVGDQFGYDYTWRGSKASGIYFAVVTAKLSDRTVREKVKFAVIR